MKTLFLSVCVGLFAMDASAAGVSVKATCKDTGFAVNRSVNPAIATGAGVSRASVSTDDVILFESFEGGGDQETGFRPEGWTYESHGDASLGDDRKWFTGYQGFGLPAPADGKHFAEILPARDKKQDEWLISPFVAVREGDVLSFHAFYYPFYFFYTDREHYDWENSKWIKQEISSNLKVLVQEEGGEFVVLHDFAESYMGMGYVELQELLFEELEKSVFELDDYAGKTVRFAFQYESVDGNVVCIDAVRVGLPEMTVSYIPGVNTLFYGSACSASYATLPASVGIYPPYTPLTWTDGGDWYEDSVYSWSYDNPDGDGVLTSDGQELTVEYHPVYADGVFSARDNMHSLPELSVKAPGYAETSFRSDMLAFQVGGHAAGVIGSATEETRFSMSSFSAPVHGLDFFVDEDWNLSNDMIPLFGYSDATRAYTTKRKFGDEEIGEDDYVDIVSIMNFIYPSAGAPMIVDGGWVNAFAEGIPDDAVFTYEIIGLAENYEPEETPVASATCTGADIIRSDDYLRDYVCLPFRFDRPAVVDDSHIGYIVKFSGFNNKNIKFFAPLQSTVPDDSRGAIAWMEHEISYGGVVRSSMIPMAYTEVEGKELFCAFALNLDAYYPWLRSDVESVSLDGGCSTEIALDTYFDASQLTVEASPWLTAVGAGRYADTKIMLTAAPTSEARDGEVIVKAPGFEKKFAVKQAKTTSIGNIVLTPSAEIEAVYTVSGVKVNTGDVVPGVYIVRYTDGTTVKKFVGVE